jgi:hypothetical protein
MLQSVMTGNNLIDKSTDLYQRHKVYRYMNTIEVVAYIMVTLLEIWHFATVLCNWFPVACDTCNWKFAQLRTTSCMKFAVACDSRIIQVHTVGLYGFIHPYSILAVGHATACNYRGCVHTALHVN